MPHFRPYLTHAELTERLQQLSATHPQRMKLEEIGQTPEGRSIWMAVLTDYSRGEPEDKPAVWLDGNTHAAELASSMFCLHVITQFCEASEGDPVLLDLLSRKTLYVVPRITPDGTDYVLREGKPLRSVPRKWPEKRPPGFVAEDMDGDGRVRQMRRENPGGAWKSSHLDSRVLIPRRPGDTEGPFYDLFMEGRFEEGSAVSDGVTSTSPYGYDFNRNYPHGWRGDYAQRGAGDYPLSHPETRAVVEAFLAQKRVSIALTYHTYCGAILRPYSYQSDEEMKWQDKTVFEALGKVGTERTGYPAMSVYHGFTHCLPNSMSGGFDDWAYEHAGVYAFTVEMWNVAERAGVETPNPTEFHFLGKMAESELKKIIDWSDAHPHYGGFKDWQPLMHPELGELEVGGWDRMGFWQNPPGDELASECERNFSFVTAMLEATPELVIEPPSIEKIGSDLWSVELQVRNDGYLPSSGSSLGKSRGEGGKVFLELDVSESQTLVRGNARESAECLEGFGSVHEDGFSDPISFRGSSSRRSHTFSWVIGGSGSVTLDVNAGKAGRKTLSVELKDNVQ